MSLSRRLAALKKAANMTTEALSGVSGVPKGTINKLLNGETENPRAHTLQRLAAALGCSPEALYSDIPADIHPQPHPEYPYSENIPNASAANISGKNIPAANNSAENIPAAYVSSPNNSAENIPGSGAAPASPLTFCGENQAPSLPSADFSIPMPDDSMAASRIKAGDIVHILRDASPEDGSLAAIKLNGVITLRRIYRIKDGVTLMSENPDFPPVVLLDEAAAALEILGRAVSFTSLL